GAVDELVEEGKFGEQVAERLCDGVGGDQVCDPRGRQREQQDPQPDGNDHVLLLPVACCPAATCVYGPSRHGSGTFPVLRAPATARGAGKWAWAERGSPGRSARWWCPPSPAAC